MKYHGYIFNNGRIAWVSEKDFSDAIELGKEILISCGGWSGGYTRAIGANKTTYDGELCWECYGYEIKDQSFTSEEMQKFHKLIFTNGIRVYMKTGEPANRYFGGNFADYDTSYEDFRRKWNFKNQTKEEFEKLRFEVDVEMTKRMNVHNDEQMEIWDSIKGFIY